MIAFGVFGVLLFDEIFALLFKILRSISFMKSFKSKVYYVETKSSSFCSEPKSSFVPVFKKLDAL